MPKHSPVTRLGFQKHKLKVAFFIVLSGLFSTLVLCSSKISETSLYARCGRQIPWISDGIRLIDRTYPGRRKHESFVDRAALLARAMGEAKRKHRLILWYCMRGPDSPMYRGEVLDSYVKVAILSDPGVVDLVRSKFIPLRMACDDQISLVTGIKRLDFIEPGFVILTPEGKVVHIIDRIRTFNADWVRAALIAILKTLDVYNEPIGHSTEELIQGGDDDLAYDSATVDQKALILRRAGRFEEVLRLPCSPLHKGIALVGLRRFSEARQHLVLDSSPESAYYLAALEVWTGNDAETRWEDLVHKFPDSPWAWRAASELVKGRDTLRDGPLSHLFQDVFLLSPKQAPSSTRLPGADLEATAHRAIDYLLRAQRSSGAWTDTRYCYWPNIRIRPNVIVAVTALAALALHEWREVDPSRIDDAVTRAENYILDESHLNPGCNEECYAHAYRLLLLSRKKRVADMNRIIPKLTALQDREGFWSHEYPNPFATAAVVHCLHQARQTGADVPDFVFKKAAGALTRTRGQGGRQAYHAGGQPSSEKNSSGRIAPCELALYECGKGSIEEVTTALDVYWRHYEQLEAIRLYDFHADEGIAGFFFFHALFHTSEAAGVLGDRAARKDHLVRFREKVMSIPEWDGSFIDSHELGKSYGTAMALLVLSRTRSEDE